MSYPIKSNFSEKSNCAHYVPPPTPPHIASGFTTVFQDARGSIVQYISRIIGGLNRKKNEMFAEIVKLEKEFIENYQKKRSEIDKLKCLQKQTRELSENTLSSMQNTIYRELEQGVKQLNLEIEKSRKPNFRININWGMCITTILSQIHNSNILTPKIVQINRGIFPNTQLNQPINTLKRYGPVVVQTESKKIHSQNSHYVVNYKFT